jgi:hypothetical protein
MDQHCCADQGTIAKVFSVSAKLMATERCQAITRKGT